MSAYTDFTQFHDVEISGVDIGALSQEQTEVLYTQARYCQAMCDADMQTLSELISDDMVFTHMSGRQQSKSEYLRDIEKGRLDYFTIGIENPVITVDGNRASVSYTSVLNANAYGARGVYRMGGTHHYELRDGVWTTVNA